MPTLYVKDAETMEYLRIEESFSSLVWTERYQEYGDFVLDIPLNAANVDVYKRGNYLFMDDSEDVMIVETVEINNDVEAPTLEVSGRSLTSILDRRVNASRALELNFVKIGQENSIIPVLLESGSSSYTSYSSSSSSTSDTDEEDETAVIGYYGSLSSVVSGIVENEITNPVLKSYQWYHKEVTSGDHTITAPGKGGIGEETWIEMEEESAPERKISNFLYENSVPSTVVVNKEYNKIMTVYELLKSFAQKTMTGFRVVFDENNNFVLKTYQGSDRTSKQSTLSPVIFGPVMDNVTYVKYYEDATNYKNIAFAYRSKDSDDQSDDISYTWVANPHYENAYSARGLDRYEIAIDVGSSVSGSTEQSSSSNTQPGNDDATGTPMEVLNKMGVAAKDEFEDGDYDLVQTTEGAIDPLASYTFGTDYFIGDTVEIYDDLGIHAFSIIDEVVRSYDDDGYVVTPNFANMIDYDYGSEGDPEEDEQ